MLYLPNTEHLDYLKVSCKLGIPAYASKYGGIYEGKITKILQGTINNSGSIVEDPNVDSWIYGATFGERKITEYQVFLWKWFLNIEDAKKQLKLDFLESIRYNTNKIKILESKIRSLEEGKYEYFKSQ